MELCQRIRSACLVASLSLLSPTAVQASLGHHIGNADPISEGWQRAYFVGEDLVFGTPAIPVSVGPVTGDSGFDAWEIVDPAAGTSNGGYSLLLTQSQETDVTTRGFVVRATVKKLENTLPNGARVFVLGTTESSTNARWVMFVGADIDGDPTVQIQGGGSAELDGAGGGYHTFELRLDLASSSLATISIDGQVVLTDQPSVIAEGNKPRFIYFGSWSNAAVGGARYNEVEFAVFEPPAVPALSLGLPIAALAMLLAVVVGLRLHRWRVGQAGD